ncbi:MAG: ferrous iron transport protein B [Gemmatimonadaceae bacterium]
MTAGAPVGVRAPVIAPTGAPAVIAPTGAPIDREAAQQGTLRVALVGNPNTGKTTLFNALTGMRQRVANFAGVTVERVEGSYRGPDGRRVSVIDLPGSYSLSAHTPDETIALDVLLGRAADVPLPEVIVVVVDAQNLERNLFLVSQLLELGRPLVVALNQSDAAEADGIRIDVVELISELGVTVIPTVATKGHGVERLRHAIARAESLPRPGRKFELPEAVESALAAAEDALVRQGFSRPQAGLEALMLVARTGSQFPVPSSQRGGGPPGTWTLELGTILERARAALSATGFNPASLEAELRYQWITGVIARTVTRATLRARNTTDRVDAVLLHRVWGPLIFLAIMTLMFQAVFAWAQPIMDAVEGMLGGLGVVVGAVIPPGDLRSLITDGVIAGVGSVLVFLPQIAILFLFIGILEDSGYMARAAFIMDRYMRRVGLHGRSFIPLISGYACAVPAIMSTRTIERSNDRLATMMVVPLMSCSARLPVYTLLIGAFVPSVAVLGIFDLKGVTLLAMYLLGTVTALGVAFVFRRTLLKGRVQPLILELPPYRIPSPRTLFTSVVQRASLFLRRAGTIILALSVVLWALASYPKQVPSSQFPVPGAVASRNLELGTGNSGEAAAQEYQLAHSVLGQIGRAIEPLVRPLGFDWKIGVSIVSSFAAREVFVSTMGTIYGVGADDRATLEALPERLRAERDAAGQPIYTTLTAIGLMVFYVYALMCMSTVAVTVREAGGGRQGWRWAGLQFGYMLALAYVAAWLVRQVGLALGYGG